MMTGHVVIKLATTLTGQLFAFDAATRLSGGGRWAALAVALVGAAYNAATLLSVPWVGRLADQRGHERVLAAAPLVGAGSTALATMAALAGMRGAGGAVLLAFARAVEGVALACTIPTMLTLVSRASEGDPARRTRMMGMLEITGLAGLFGGLLLAGVLWERLGTRSLLPLAMVYALSLPLLRRPVIPAQASPHRADHAAEGQALGATIRTLASERAHLAFVVLWLAVNAVVGLWLQYVPYLLILGGRVPGQRLVGSVSGTSASAVLMAIALLYAGGTALVSLFAARWTRRALLAGSISGIVVMAAAAALVNHGASSGWLALVALSLAAQGGITPLALAHLGDLSGADDRSRGAIMGVYSLLLGVGQFLGAALGGPFIARWHFDGLLGLSAALGLMALGGLAAMPLALPAARPSTVSAP